MLFFRGLIFLFFICSFVSVKAQSDEEIIKTDIQSEEDSIDDEAEIEDEKIKNDILNEMTDTQAKETVEDAIIDGVPVASKNVETEVMFVEPALNKRSSGAGVELPANKLVKVLVSFTNKELETAGEEKNTFKLDVVEGFLRYPSDYSYFLQNFTARQLQDLVVEPRREATVEYSFVPALQLAGRPFGLTLRLTYHDNKGKYFTSTFFNDTIQVIELDEGFDTESLFLYLLVAAVVGLAGFGIYHLFNVYALRKFKKSTSTKPPVEYGTSLRSEVDLQWIPKEHLKQRQSPTLSPRKRKNRRNEENHVTGH